MIDVQLLQSLPTGLFVTPMLRVDTCAINNLRAYEADSSFFTQNPTRRLYIREAYDDEFTAPMNIADYAQIPALQTLVVKLADGMHLAALVFLGRRFANVSMRTDADVAQVLTQMQRHISGYCDDDWKRFMQKALDNQRAIEATVDNAAGRVH